MDIPRIFTAVAEWGACVLFVSFLKKRFKLFPSVLLLAAWLCVISLWQNVAGRFPLALWPLGMFVAVTLVFLCIYSCCRVRLAEALYWTIPAFMVAELFASFAWQCFFYIYLAFPWGKEAWAEYAVLFFIYAVCITLLWLLETRFASLRPLDITYKDVTAVFALGVISFVVSNLNFIDDFFDDTVATKIYEIRTLVDLCGVALLYFYRIQRAWMLSKTELTAMHNILHQQYEQYCRYKENEETIHRHYHDLKHQIDVILSEQDVEARKKYLEDMRLDLRRHDAEYSTGNEVLDTVLTGKNLSCIKDGVTLTAVADGRLLNFMTTMDLCSVFGNALDNAIESVKKVEDTDKRLIQLAVFSQDDWVVVRIKNYFEESLRYENENLVTSKPDRANHGYGLKSIRHVCEKYLGSMTILAENNWFNLCLLFPAAAAPNVATRKKGNANHD